MSKTQTMYTGHRGSVTGPLVTKININELHETVETSNGSLFADDMPLLMRRSDLNTVIITIMIELNELNRYCLGYKWAIHADTRNAMAPGHTLLIAN